MKEQTTLRVAVAAGVASLLTVALLGYRLLNHTSPESANRPPVLIASQSLTPEEAKLAVDAIFALILPDLGGRPQPVAEWKGKVLVVNYWASWCKPCVDEMPAFSRMNSHYASWGVQFVGIGLDDEAKLASFIKTMPVSYPVLVAGATDPTRLSDDPFLSIAAWTSASLKTISLSPKPALAWCGKQGRMAVSRMASADFMVDLGAGLIGGNMGKGKWRRQGRPCSYPDAPAHRSIAAQSNATLDCRGWWHLSVAR